MLHQVLPSYEKPEYFYESSGRCRTDVKNCNIMKRLGVFTVSTMDIPFVFSNPELVLSSVSSSKATNTYCIGAEDISEVKKGYS